MVTAAVPPTTTARDDDGEALGVAASSISVVAIASSPKEEGLYSRGNNHSLHNEDDDTASLSSSRRSNKRQMHVDTNYAVTKKRLLADTALLEHAPSYISNSDGTGSCPVVSPHVFSQGTALAVSSKVILSFFTRHY